MLNAGQDHLVHSNIGPSPVLPGLRSASTTASRNSKVLVVNIMKTKQHRITMSLLPL